MNNSCDSKLEGSILVQVQICRIIGANEQIAYRYMVGAMGVECQLPPLMDGQRRSLVEVSDFMVPKNVKGWIDRMAKTYHPLEEDTTSIPYDYTLNPKQKQVYAGKCDDERQWKIATDQLIARSK